MLWNKSELSPEFTNREWHEYLWIEGTDHLDLDFESLSDGKKWHVEALNNWEINRVIDETRVAKESILD